MFSHVKCNKINLICQTIALMVFVSLVLFSFSLVSTSAVLWAVGSGALSSSAYLVFASPQSPVARPVRIIGGYLIAIIVGACFHAVLGNLYMLMDNKMTFMNPHLFWVSATLAVGISMFLMVLLGLPHPPAAGVALVLVLDIKHYGVMFIILAAAIVLALVQVLFHDKLKELI